MDAVGAEVQPARVEQVASLVTSRGREAKDAVGLGLDRHRLKAGTGGDPRGVGAGGRLRQSKGGNLTAGDPAQEQVAGLARAGRSPRAFPRL